VPAVSLRSLATHDNKLLHPHLPVLAHSSTLWSVLSINCVFGIRKITLPVSALRLHVDVVSRREIAAVAVIEQSVKLKLRDLSVFLSNANQRAAERLNVLVRIAASHL
jgi:hypothetical protein